MTKELATIARDSMSGVFSPDGDEVTVLMVGFAYAFVLTQDEQIITVLITDLVASRNLLAIAGWTVAI